jgi:hypothetical protein
MQRRWRLEYWMMRVLLAQTIAAGLLTVAVPLAQERALPDQERFLGEVRTHLQTILRCRPATSSRQKISFE